MENEFLHQSADYLHYPFNEYCSCLFNTIWAEYFYELINTDPEDPYPPYIATEAIKWHIRQWFAHNYYQHHLLYNSQPLSIISFLQNRTIPVSNIDNTASRESTKIPLITHTIHINTNATMAKDTPQHSDTNTHKNTNNNNKNTKNNNTSTQKTHSEIDNTNTNTNDLNIEDVNMTEEDGKDINDEAPDAEATFSDPDPPNSPTTNILPCGERPQNKITIHLSIKVNPTVCNITETEVNISKAFIALDRDFQILPFNDDSLNPLTQHQKITANKEALDNYFHKRTLKQHKKFSTLHILFRVKSRDNIHKWRQNSHFLNWLKANQVWIRQTVIMESKVTNIGWFQNLHPDTTHFQTLREIFTKELTDHGYDFPFELEIATPFQPKDEEEKMVSTRAVKLVVATKDIAVATEGFLNMFNIGFAGYRNLFLKNVNFIPYGRNPNITRIERAKVITIHINFLHETGFFFIKNLTTVEEKVQFQGKN